MYQTARTELVGIDQVDIACVANSGCYDVTHYLYKTVIHTTSCCDADNKPVNPFVFGRDISRSPLVSY